MKSLKSKTIKIAVSALFLSISIQTMASPTSPVMRITALGGVNTAIMRVEPPQNFILLPDFSLVSGGLITADFLEYVKFDTGFIYKQSRFNVLNSGISVSNMFYEQFVIPVTARFEFKFLSAGAGFFYETRVKNKFTQVDYGITTGTTLTTLDKAGVRANNFGFMGTLGVRYKLPALPIGFMADIWYLQGLNEMWLNTFDKISLKQKDLQLLIGVSLYL
ncbi:MAG: hypothetical protein OEV78_03380 [Spirochaetia bacterium]|nr:hypothetical protein [Spirochaetia bacterium]